MRSTVTDAVVVTVRNLRHFTREPGLLLFSTIQPVMFVLLFVYVFGGAIQGSLPAGVSYVDFLLPGIFDGEHSLRVETELLRCRHLGERLVEGLGLVHPGRTLELREEPDLHAIPESEA